MKPKILFVANVDWFFISHRLVIALEAKRKGFDVFVAAEDTGRSHEIIENGIRYINLPFSRSGTNPFYELFTIFKFYNLYTKINPDIIHHITLKPVIYGSLIAKILKLKNVVNAVSGLGYNFTNRSMNFISKVMLLFMKYSFKNNITFIFQNQDDYNELLELKVLSSKNKIYFIKGSGVNLEDFFPIKLHDFNKINIVLPSRMLIDKGVYEFHAAAILLKDRYYGKIQFVMAGIADSQNKAGISESILKKWNDRNYFNWVGHKEKIFDVYQNAHIVVLPSYREGMPKSLIEACAMGRAIITTNAVGCRNCVDDGINGLIVPVKDAQSLANAIEYLVNNPNKIVEMGFASRIKAEKEFDINTVIRIHLEIYHGFI